MAGEASKSVLNGVMTFQLSSPMPVERLPHFIRSIVSTTMATMRLATSVGRREKSNGPISAVWPASPAEPTTIRVSNEKGLTANGGQKNTGTIFRHDLI